MAHRQARLRLPRQVHHHQPMKTVAEHPTNSILIVIEQPVHLVKRNTLPLSGSEVLDSVLDPFEIS